MAGILFAFFAGLFIALQNAFNTNLQGYLGTWETTSIVNAIGLVFSFSMVLILGTRDYSGILQMEGVNKIYLLGGIFGALVVYSSVRSISLLGVALTVSIIVVSQLAFSALIDHFGWFGMTKIPLSGAKIIGLALMVIGVIIFKSKS